MSGEIAVDPDPGSHGSREALCAYLERQLAVGGRLQVPTCCDGDEDEPLTHTGERTARQLLDAFTGDWNTDLFTIVP